MLILPRKFSLHSERRWIGLLYLIFLLSKDFFLFFFPFSFSPSFPLFRFRFRLGFGFGSPSSLSSIASFPSTVKDTRSSNAAFTLPDKEIETGTVTDTDKLTQNPRGICVYICLCVV